MSKILPIGAGLAILAALMFGGSKDAKADTGNSDAGDEPDDKISDKGDAASSGAGKAGKEAASAAKAKGSEADAKAEAARIIAEEGMAILASGDPEKIEAYAKRIEAWYPEAAKDARALIAFINEARNKPTGGGATPAPTPKKNDEEPAAPSEPVAPSGTTQANKSLASKVALMVRNTKPGKEDKSLLLTFSQANNLRNSSGGFDGLYGRRVGVCLAKTYGIVPPRPPVSWGTTKGGYASIGPDKQLYRTAMLEMANSDGARSDEWTAAAAAVKG